MNRARIPTALAAALVLALLAVSAPPASAQDAGAEAITKPIDRMIKLIRYGKFDRAGKSLDSGGMAQELLQDTWEEMSAEQRKEFTEGFAYLMENLSFPKVKDNFEYLDDISYGDPEVEGDRARVSSVIVIDHPTKGEEEIELQYVMSRDEESGWRVLDVYLDEESTLEGIREDQIEELLDDGGVELLIEKLNERVAEVREERAKEAEQEG